MYPPKSQSINDVSEAKDDERERLLDAADDDDFFLKGPSGNRTVQFATDKLTNVAAGVSAATDAMRANASRLLQRGEQLEALSARSHTLAATSDSFRASSGRLRRRVWWQDTKTRLVLAAVLMVLLLLVLVPIIVKHRAAAPDPDSGGPSDG